MKIKQSEAVELLQKLGVQGVELVADDAESEFDADTAIKAVDDSRIAFHKPAIEAEVMATADRAAAGKFGGSMRRSLAKITGVPASELEKIEKDADAIAHAFAKNKESLSGETKAMQDEIEKERAEWSREKESLVSEWEDKVKTEKDRFYDREIGASIATMLKDAPLPQTADRDRVSKMIKESLGKEFELQYDEATQTTRIIDTKTNLPAKNKAGTANFDVMEYAKDYLSPIGIWQTDMRNVDAGRQMQNGNEYNNGDKGQSFDTSMDPVKAAGQRGLSAAALQG